MERQDVLQFLEDICRHYGITSADLEQLSAGLQAAPVRVSDAATLLHLPEWMSSPPNDLSLRRLVSGEPESTAWGTALPAIEGLGARPMANVQTWDLDALVTAVWRRTGLAEVAKARWNQRPLMSYRPEDHGQGAARNLAEAMHRFFAQAVREGILRDNPADGMTFPSSREDRRPLTAVEVGWLYNYIDVRSDDPRLDRVIVDLLLHTGARSGGRRKPDGGCTRGLLTLTVDAVDPSQCLLHTYQKYSQLHERPVRRSVLLGALRLAASRGARQGSDPLLLNSDGTAVTHRRLDTLFRNAQRDLVWRRALPVSAHWLRVTCVERVRDAAGDRISSAWAGHSPKSSRYATTEKYWSKVRPDELRAAAELTFGPLADVPLDLSATPFTTR